MYVYQLSTFQYARRKHCKGKVADNGSSPQLTNLLNATHYRKETTRLLRNLCSNPSRTASSQTLSGKETCANVRIVSSFFYALWLFVPEEEDGVVWLDDRSIVFVICPQLPGVKTLNVFYKFTYLVFTYDYPTIFSDQQPKPVWSPLIYPEEKTLEVSII